MTFTCARGPGYHGVQRGTPAAAPPPFPTTTVSFDAILPSTSSIETSFFIQDSCSIGPSIEISLPNVSRDSQVYVPRTMPPSTASVEP